MASTQPPESKSYGSKIHFYSPTMHADPFWSSSLFQGRSRSRSYDIPDHNININNNNSQHPIVSSPQQRQYYFSQQQHIQSVHHHYPRQQQQQQQIYQQLQHQPIQFQQQIQIHKQQQNPSVMDIVISELPQYWAQFNFLAKQNFSFLLILKCFMKSVLEVVELLSKLTQMQHHPIQPFAFVGLTTIDEFNDQYKQIDQTAIDCIILRDKSCELLTYYMLICLDPKFISSSTSNCQLTFPQQYHDIQLKITSLVGQSYTKSCDQLKPTGHYCRRANEYQHNYVYEFDSIIPINPTICTSTLNTNGTMCKNTIKTHGIVDINTLYLTTGNIHPTQTSGNLFIRTPLELITRSDVLPIGQILPLYKRIYQLILPFLPQIQELQSIPSPTELAIKYNYTSQLKESALTRCTYLNPHGFTEKELENDFNCRGCFGARIRVVKLLQDRLPRIDDFPDQHEVWNNFIKMRCSQTFSIEHLQSPNISTTTTTSTTPSTSTTASKTSTALLSTLQPIFQYKDDDRSSRCLSLPPINNPILCSSSTFIPLFPCKLPAIALFKLNSLNISKIFLSEREILDTFYFCRFIK